MVCKCNCILVVLLRGFYNSASIHPLTIWSAKSPFWNCIIFISNRGKSMVLLLFKNHIFCFETVLKLSAHFKMFCKCSIFKIGSTQKILFWNSRWNLRFTNFETVSTLKIRNSEKVVFWIVFVIFQVCPSHISPPICVRTLKFRMVAWHLLAKW